MKKHGQYKTRTYQKWQQMKRRCYNPRAVRYHRYGGRGITVCARWLHSFPNFLEDMGECPQGLSLHRIENDGNYEKANCKWATDEEQASNTSINKYLTFRGRTLHFAAWARELGENSNLISRRLKAGWSVEQILTTPSKGNEGYRTAPFRAG